MLNNDRITLKKISVNFDILPERYKRKRISFRQVLVLLYTVAGAVLLVFLYQVSLDAMFGTTMLQEEAAVLNTRLQLRRVSVIEQVKMTSLVDEYDEIDGRRGVVYEDMVAIKDAADQVGIGIFSITFGENSILVKCPSDGYAAYSDYRDTFDSYYQALLQTERFTSVERPPTDWSPSTSYVTIEVAH